MNEWCDPSGGYGSKWKDKWGTFEERSKNGQNANFCPQCGCKGKLIDAKYNLPIIFFN